MMKKRGGTGTEINEGKINEGEINNENKKNGPTQLPSIQSPYIDEEKNHPNVPSRNNNDQIGGKKKTRARARKVNKSVSPIRRRMMKKRGGNLDEHLNNVKSTLGGLINQLH
jgi:hypothetical protein